VCVRFFLVSIVPSIQVFSNTFFLFLYLKSHPEVVLLNEPGVMSTQTAEKHSNAAELIQCSSTGRYQELFGHSSAGHRSPLASDGIMTGPYSLLRSRSLLLLLSRLFSRLRPWLLPRSTGFCRCWSCFFCRLDTLRLRLFLRLCERLRRLRSLRLWCFRSLLCLLSPLASGLSLFLLSLRLRGVSLRFALLLSLEFDLATAAREHTI